MFREIPRAEAEEGDGDSRWGRAGEVCLRAQRSLSLTCPRGGGDGGREEREEVGLKLHIDIHDAMAMI